MARVWTCECGWGRKNGKEVWLKDPNCGGKHRQDESTDHGFKVSAKHTAKQPPKHRKKK